MTFLSLQKGKFLHINLEREKKKKKTKFCSIHVKGGEGEREGSYTLPGSYFLSLQTYKDKRIGPTHEWTFGNTAGKILSLSRHRDGVTKK